MANLRIGVITDEFSQDFERVCATAVELGVPELEIRMAWGKNVLDMSDGEINELKSIADRHGRAFIAVASPVYKCVLPEGGEIDERFQHDAFQASHSFNDQPRLLERALEIAARLEAPYVRVFSFWRTVDPERNRSRIVELLQAGGEAARDSGILLGLENEAACHFGTGAEVGTAISELDADVYGVVWDPANAVVCGERAFPDGFGHLPVNRICHVHAKDLIVDSSTSRYEWCDVGRGQVGWAAQLAALVEADYDGSVSLETHWGGPGGDKFEASSICARSLARLVAAV